MRSLAAFHLGDVLNCRHLVVLLEFELHVHDFSLSLEENLTVLDVVLLTLLFAAHHVLASEIKVDSHLATVFGFKTESVHNISLTCLVDVLGSNQLL